MDTNTSVLRSSADLSEHHGATVTGAEGSIRQRKPEFELEKQDSLESRINSRRRWFRPVSPSEPFTFKNQMRKTVFSSWFNLFLLCCPAGFVVNYVRGKTVETFVLNIVATIPLGIMGEKALEEMAKRLGKTLEQLIYLFTSNLVLLISCILLLVNGQGSVVQVTLAGSILANLLFVLGLSIAFGGLRRQNQYFNLYAARVSSNMLSLSATSLLIPTSSRLLGQATAEDLVKQSRGAAFILITVYVAYLWCQLRTHKTVFLEESQKVPLKPRKKEPIDGAIQAAMLPPVSLMGQAISGASDNERSERGVAERSVAVEYYDDDDDDDAKKPELHGGVAIAVFIISNVLLYFCIDFVVNSIDALTTAAGVSKMFIGLILLPLPNCDFSPVAHAVKDDMDQTVTYTVGKCLQTALLVTPLVVLISWAGGFEDITLAFDGFEVISLFAAVFLLNFLIVEAKVSWIQGILLLADWALVALAAFFTTSVSRTEATSP